MTEQDQQAANLVAVATAASQGERLAVVETKVTAIASDLAEVKTDVKSLLARAASGDGQVSLLSRAVPWVALLVSIALAISVRGG